MGQKLLYVISSSKSIRARVIQISIIILNKNKKVYWEQGNVVVTERNNNVWINNYGKFCIRYNLFCIFYYE